MLYLQRNVVAVVPMFDPDKIGSIWVPEQAKERCDQGIVKYLGPDCELVKIGDHIIFSGYTGTTVEIEGEGSLLIFLPEDFIIAKLEEPDTLIPGLYFKGVDGRFFDATYEQALTLIGRAFDELQDPKRFNVKGNTRPDPKVYDNH